MSSSIQGPGSTQHTQQAHQTKSVAPEKGSGLNRSISAAPGLSHISKGVSPTGVSLSSRSVGVVSLAEKDILTPQGLRDVAGDPKSTLFKSSPTYTKLLNSLEHYQQLKSSDAPNKEQSAALDDVIAKAQVFSEKKVGEAKGKTGDKLKQIMSRISGAERVIRDAKAEQAVLTVQALAPSSLTDIQSNIALYDAAGGQGAEYLHNHLSAHPPSTVAELKDAAPLYSDESLLEKHFNNIPDSNKARDLMIKAPPGSPLKKIAAESWAPRKIAKEVPQIPTDEAQLQRAEKSLITKLNRQNVPAEGRDAAIAHLRATAHETWDNAQPIYQNIPAKGENTIAKQARQELEKAGDIGNKLLNSFKEIPQDLNREATSEEVRATNDNYNKLSKPQFDANNNILHDQAFVKRAKVRYGARGIEKNLLPCPKDNVVTTNGKPTYHANHIAMPLGNYIAAQGPIAKNEELYWEMLSGQHSKVSVDLTNSTDKSTGKRSYPYTPSPNESKTYDNGITVTNLGETRIMDGKFTIQKLEVNGELHTRIQHNGFDDRTSGNPTELVALSLLAKELNSDPDTPVVVHCSAGIGRTGTLITVMDQVDQAMEGKSHSVTDGIDIFRKARGEKGVQTAGQLCTINKTHDHLQTLMQPMLKAMG